MPEPKRYTDVPRYATCECAGAVALGRNHLRVLEPGESLRTGGIASTREATTLCGRDLTAGWDLAEAPPARVVELAHPREGDGRVWLCAGCFKAWADTTTPTTPPLNQGEKS